jgi:hypothetical protein
MHIDCLNELTIPGVCLWRCFFFFVCVSGAVFFLFLCLCSYETMRSFPADLVVRCMAARANKGIQRAAGGNSAIAARLGQYCDVRCSAEIEAVRGGRPLRGACSSSFNHLFQPCSFLPFFFLLVLHFVFRHFVFRQSHRFCMNHYFAGQFVLHCEIGHF